MVPDIVDWGPLVLFGITTRASVRAYRSFSELPRFWDDWMRRRRWREIALPAVARPLYGLCGPAADQEFEYAICLEASADTRLPQGWQRFEVAGCRRAIFHAEGPQPRAIQEATLAAYARWLPASGMARGEGFDLEVYYPEAGDGACRSEVRIPLPEA
jgi:predicted transcriptional regulator YdeE